MQKLLAGCLVVLALCAVLLGVGLYLAYRAASPLIEDARGYLQQFSELEALEREIKNTAPHEAPASGELSEAQIERFVRVQTHVRDSLGQRMREFEEKYKHLSSESGSGAQPSLRDMLGGLGELAGLYVQARRYQVEALNREGFSQDEYEWVRARVFEAAGIEVANAIDFQALEQAVREGTGAADFEAPRIPDSSVPARNRELVKPHLEKLREWIPLAVFGL